MQEDNDPRVPERDEEWTIEGVEDRVPPVRTVWVAVGSTVAAAAVVLIPFDSNSMIGVGFYVYVLGALFGLVSGVNLAFYRQSRRIGVCCAVISLALLVLFVPLFALKDWIMGGDGFLLP